MFIKTNMIDQPLSSVEAMIYFYDHNCHHTDQQFVYCTDADFINNNNLKLSIEELADSSIVACIQNHDVNKSVLVIQRHDESVPDCINRLVRLYKFEKIKKTFDSIDCQ